LANYAGIKEISVSQKLLGRPVCNECGKKGVDGVVSSADVGGGAVDDCGELVDGRGLSHVGAVGRGPGKI
jgi:hypothetical protein